MSMAMRCEPESPQTPSRAPGEVVEAGRAGVACEAVHLEGRLDVTAGQASDRGLRAENDDCMGLCLPEEPTRTLRGIAAVVADGVSSAEAGREAAELCVQNFLTDYFSTPDTWTVKHAARVVLTSLNRWLYAKSHASKDAHRGYVSTLSALVVKSRTAHLFHVGDSRIQRLRGGRLEPLTRDHTARISEQESLLARAMGMDAHLEVDYRELEVLPGDCFLLSTDGLHGWLPETELQDLLVAGLGAGRGCEKLCLELIGRAKEHGSDDNLTCQILRVDAVGPADRDEVVRELTQLPFPPPLAPGMRLDGYRVERELHASARSQIHLVIDEQTGERLAMKTPSVNYDDDPAYIERFVMESWIGRRIRHPNVVRVGERTRPPTCLYYVMEYVEGPTLAAWYAAHPEATVREKVALVEQIAAGLRAFERLEMVHQDVKPENVLVDGEGRVRIVDFGSCWVAGIQEIAAPIARDVALGTASYSAPETRWGETAGVRSDLFALGVVAYELLTGKHPYGEALERCRSPRDFSRLEYAPSYHHDPMVPVWIDGALRRAVSLSVGRRYEALSEFVHDLRHPNARFLREGHRPLVERDPVRFWQGVAGLLAVALGVALWAAAR